MYKKRKLRVKKSINIQQYRPLYGHFDRISHFPTKSVPTFATEKRRISNTTSVHRQKAKKSKKRKVMI